MARMTRRAATLGALLGVPALGRAVAQPSPVVVFARGTLQDELRELEPALRDAGGPPPRFSFAASSALARQPEQGAQADLLPSADEAWVDYAERMGGVACRSDVVTSRAVREEAVWRRHGFTPVGAPA